SWEGPFHDEATVNLLHYFLEEVVPDRLGKRWPDRGSDYRNFVTPMKERITPRADSDARDEYSLTVNIALEKHQADPWPAAALEQVISSAGELGLDKTRFSMERLAKAIPPVTDREAKWRELEKAEWDRFMRGERPDIDLSGKPKDRNEQKKREERQALEDEFRYDLPFVIREPLRLALEQIDAVHDSGKLSLMTEKQDEGGIWALQQLQIHHPQVYSELMIARFKDAETPERSLIFNTLVAANPKAADKLKRTLSEDDQKALTIELTRFELEHDPAEAKERIVALLGILEDKPGKQSWDTRGPAIEFLAKIPLDEKQRLAFEELLIREINEPRRDNTISIVGLAYIAIRNLPDPERHWKVLLDNADKASGWGEFHSLMETLCFIQERNPERYRKELLDLLKQRLVKSPGMMNDLFEASLAMDFRELSPEIIALASDGPEVPDGKGANSWGGDFTGPGSNRYHAARHVIALWQEPDPETVARMWTSLVIKQPHEFNGPPFMATRLRERSRKAFEKIPPSLKSALISRIREKQPAYAEVADALESQP
ncbi:MAG TPA: hypothetical protein VM511_05185, partial [Luteolibacter sp.]|nr:hypothetical protein [Luteolibacter sp.]